MSLTENRLWRGLDYDLKRKGLKTKDKNKMGEEMPVVKRKEYTLLLNYRHISAFYKISIDLL